MPYEDDEIGEARSGEERRGKRPIDIAARRRRLILKRKFEEALKATTWSCSKRRLSATSVGRPGGEDLARAARPLLKSLRANAATRASCSSSGKLERCFSAIAVNSSTACRRLIFFRFVATRCASLEKLKFRLTATRARFNRHSPSMVYHEHTINSPCPQACLARFSCAIARFIALSDATDSYFEFVVFGPYLQTIGEFLV
jgi:hypothetical protein